MATQIDVSIITVGMNHSSFIKKLYNTLYSLHRPNISFEAIYIDNCSKDDSVEFIRNSYPEVKIIENDKIHGFSYNNNIGARIAVGKYLAIINPDIQLLENCLDILFAFYEENKQTGIVVPMLLNPDLTLQYSVRNFINIPFLFSRILTKGNDNSEKKKIKSYLCKDLDSKQTQFINWSIGAALFLSREFFNEIKGFDEDYFLYMEDEDLCLRSWKAKRPVVYHPKSKMIHNHLRSSKKIGKRTFMHFKSLLIFFLKHGFFIKDHTKDSVTNFQNKDK